MPTATKEFKYLRLTVRQELKDIASSQQIDFLFVDVIHLPSYWYELMLIFSSSKLLVAWRGTTRSNRRSLAPRAKQDLW